MESEVSGLIGPVRGERAPDGRLKRRSGYRRRAGLGLTVPKDPLFPELLGDVVYRLRGLSGSRSRRLRPAQTASRTLFEACG